MNIKLGDKVKHKSPQSPTMIVYHIAPSGYEPIACRWFNDFGNLVSYNFAAEELTLVQED